MHCNGNLYFDFKVQSNVVSRGPDPLPVCIFALHTKRKWRGGAFSVHETKSNDIAN